MVCEMLDLNQMYVNFSEMDDVKFSGCLNDKDKASGRLNDKDKAATRDFYGE